MPNSLDFLIRNCFLPCLPPRPLSIAKPFRRLEMGNCWQCGDIGISEALLYCSKCKSAPRHSYCLDKLPENLSSEISWLCQDCIIKAPNSTSKERFLEKCPRVLLHCSGRTAIGPNDACQVIGTVNDHLVDPRDQHLMTNVRIVSTVNLDNHVSYDTKRETLSCRKGAEHGTLSPFLCAKLTEDEIGKSRKENLERKILIPLEKDELDKSIHPIDSEDINIQYEVKRLPVTSVEAHDMQIIKQNSDFNTGGLGAGRLSPCSGPRDNEIEDSEKREFRRRRLTLLSKEDLDNFCPPVVGKRSRREKKSRLILSSKVDNNHLPVDGNGTNSLFAARRLPRTPVEQTTSCTIYRIGAKRSSIRYTEKKYQYENYWKKISKARKSKLPAKVKFDNYYPYAQSSNISYTVKGVSATSVEPYNPHSVGKTLSGNMKTSSPTKSSACFGRLIPRAKENPTSEDECASASSSIEPSACYELKPVQAEYHGKEKPMRKRLIKSGMNMVDSTHSPSDGQSTVEALDNQEIDALGAVRSPFIPPAMKDQMTMISVVKGESDNDPEANILFASDRQTDEAEKHRYGKEKIDSKTLILGKKNDFSSLHPVTVSPNTGIMFADKSLPGATGVISDMKTVWRTNMNDQIKCLSPQTLCSVPVVSHVWRGTFIINKTVHGLFRAHLSSRACEKVCDLSRKLPYALYMQKLPRMVGWPNSFTVSAPTDESIALYFSPESDRVESSLDDIVDDIINYDLMLRFQFDEVELLVFSSFVLPRRNQFLNGKYYAWGVFKRRSAQVCSSPAASPAASLRRMEFQEETK